MTDVADKSAGDGSTGSCDGNDAKSSTAAITSASEDADDQLEDFQTPPRLKDLLQLDPYLTPFSGELRRRYTRVAQLLEHIDRHEGGLVTFAGGYTEFGVHFGTDGSLTWREWCPAARALYAKGEFSDWQLVPFTRQPYGKWLLQLPSGGVPERQVPVGASVTHLSQVKLVVETHDGSMFDRLSPWASYVLPPKQSTSSGGGVAYNQHVWRPPQPYIWRYERPPRPSSLRIYECHVGISSEQPRVAQYAEFVDTVLPRVVAHGYNAIQLMAIMEHAYYASFGYQVTSFFAVSSRYGTPHDLMRLVDEAHARGLYVLLDVVHSHASNNVLDGLNQFDGSDACYFHAGERGHHSLWNSRLFNYADWEVLRFLLSNLRWFLEEYRFDGFRFDGVTSMLYHSHGIGQGFSGDYGEYFGVGVDADALAYLTVAQRLVHQLLPKAITVAEDVSGMPALCRPTDEGGVGFDYRLAMAVPDLWIRLLKEQRDEHWNIGVIVHALTNRRYREPTVGYAESHDQALVGDKTLAHRLLDAEVYTGMSMINPTSLVVERGMQLHKLLRLMTHTLAGEAYLNFMGNEFGHPEWLDFPRVGNGESYHYARRQWSLTDSDRQLRYIQLAAFDAALNLLEASSDDGGGGWLQRDGEPAYVSCRHETDRLIAADRHGRLVFVFNLDGQRSLAEYRVGVPTAGCYRCRLSTDAVEFGGLGRVEAGGRHFSQPQPHGNRPHSIHVYAPSRVGLVLVLEQQ